MFNREIVHQDFGSVDYAFATLAAGGGQELTLLLAAQEEVRVLCWSSY
jgi:hypothetical protein